MLSPPGGTRLPGGSTSICRFAPSPNGRLHLGHAYSALLNARWARRTGGRLLLRMEDIDRDRCSPVFATAIRDDLAWLGVQPFMEVDHQAARFPIYAAVLDGLRHQGLVYPCFCTRGDIARITATRPGFPRDPDGAPLYPGTCRHLPDTVRAARLAAGEQAGWRLDMAEALRRHPQALAWREFNESDMPASVPAEPTAWGDALLARRTVPTSYHLAVVVDDAAQGVTDILRGDDLRAATSLHRLLQTLLGLPAPDYHHHRLVRDDEGRKLSKSAGSITLADLRRRGLTAADVRGQLGLSGDGAL